MYTNKNKFMLLLFSFLIIVALVAAQCGAAAPAEIQTGASGDEAAPAQEEAVEAEEPAQEEAAEEPAAEATEEAAGAEEPAQEEAAPTEEAVAAEGEMGETAELPDLSGLKVALLTSGPINDDGWNQTAYEGLLALEEAGAEIANTENVAQADQLDLVRSYGDQGFNIIIGHGFEYGDALLQAAEEYPEVSFIQIGGIAENGQNLVSYVFRPGEAGYALGILAGHMSPTGKIGGVGAVEIPTIAADYNAFEQAAKVANPEISDVPVAYTGSWVDIPKAKEAAIAQIDSGIDLILANGDNANVGAIEAAAEDGSTYIIGWTRDQSHLAPDLVLTSTEQRIDNILIDAVKAIQDGTIEWTNHIVGFAENAQTLAPFHPDVPAEVIEEVNSVIQAIVDGQIVLDNEGNVVTDEYHQ